MHEHGYLLLHRHRQLTHVARELQQGIPETKLITTTVEKFVAVYGGEIRAYNDRGACFEFTLHDFEE